MFWEVHPDGPQWSVRRTPAGRVFAGLGWALRGFAGALAVGTFFFGIDWVGRMTTGVPLPHAFLLTVVSFAGLVGFGAFVARMLRFRHWIVDRDGQTVALSLRRAFGDAQIQEVTFEELERLRVHRAGMGGRARVDLVFKDGTEEVLLATRFGDSAIDPVVVGLRRAFDETGVPVDDNRQE